jgi:DNA-directed RNA polymerase beta' subunit
MYRYLKKIFGNALLTDILTYKGTIDINGIINENTKLVFPFSNIGYAAFHDNFDLILDTVVSNRSKSKSNISYEVEFIKQHRDKVFITKFPLINPRLRPAHTIGGEFSFDELNIYYNYIIKHSALLRNASDLELNQKITIEATKHKIQSNLNEAYTCLTESISTKEGFIRSSLVGNRLNFSSRNVITPCDSSYQMDECSLPYLTALELLKPLIINKLRKVKRINYKKAHILFNNASLRFNKLVHAIMTELIKSENISILLNRNPSIAVGSVLNLRIRDVKEDINDYTLGIPNLILPLLGAVTLNINI